MRDPFIQAILDGDIETVLSGLEHGRDPNLPDQYGWIALHRAAVNQVNNQVRIAIQLIQAGSLLESRGTDSWTPLHLAAISGSSDVVSLLIEVGADVNARSRVGDTPLHLCVISESIESARALLVGGAVLSAKNDKGLSPLTEAQAKGNIGLVELFSGWNSSDPA